MNCQIPQGGSLARATFFCLALVAGGCGVEHGPPPVVEEPSNTAATEGRGPSFGLSPTASVAAAPVYEGHVGQTTIDVSVTLSTRSAGEVLVDYTTVDLTGTAGSDYARTKGRLIFAAGETQLVIAVPVFGDTDIEPDETIGLHFAGVNGVVVEPAVLTLSILNDDPELPGLPARPENTTCVAPDRPIGNAAIATELAFPNLLPWFSKPVQLLQAPNDTSQWYVVEQDGRILRFNNDPAAATWSLFVDVRGWGTAIDVNSTDQEAGLLSFDFHPDYGTDNYETFLSYLVEGLGGSSTYVSVIARFRSLDNGMTLDADEAADADVLISFDQPFNNHNGGQVMFGPDGYLYAVFGDGGSGDDPGDRAQNVNNLFGSMLRIDVDGGVPYGVPPGNFYSGNALCNAGSGSEPCPELFAWGLRNAWRWNFDDVTGDLWLGDVGESSYEEINIVENAGNYGWRCREGAHPHILTGVCPPGLIDPIIEYGRSDGKSVTGGFVYRGTAIPELVGRYVFADYSEGKIFASVADGQGGFSYEMLLDTPYFISSFAEEPNGELLFLDYVGGRIHRIVQGSGSSVDTIPDQLSMTGCVDSVDPTMPASGLIPYSVNAPFWSDGADKTRYYAIPDGTTIDVDLDGDWLFPNGTVLMKHFRLNNELFETRLFMRHPDGIWAGYTYEWNQSGTDATRVVGGKSKIVQDQLWSYPSESQCGSCHTQAANFSLGIGHGQLNGDFLYPSTGITANQLVTADSINVLAQDLPGPPSSLVRLPDPTDGNNSLDSRARSYLHSNCSGCHRPQGPTPAAMDLRFSTALADLRVCDEIPVGSDLGIAGARLLAPGNPALSLLVVRMNRRDVHGMPPLGSNVVDTAGVQLISDWATSIQTCP